MSGKTKFESTRRRLTQQQAETVDRLTAAAITVLRDKGFADLTVRMVAAEAGVAAATAYTYFSSKSHLVAELFWRRLDAVPHEPLPGVGTGSAGLLGPSKRRTARFRRTGAGGGQ